MQALELGARAVNSAAAQIDVWAKKYGKAKKAETAPARPDLVEILQGFCGPELKEIFCQWSKVERDIQIKGVWNRILERFCSSDEVGSIEETQGTYKEKHMKSAFKVLTLFVDLI